MLPTTIIFVGLINRIATIPTLQPYQTFNVERFFDLFHFLICVQFLLSSLILSPLLDFMTRKGSHRSHFCHDAIVQHLSQFCFHQLVLLEHKLLRLLVICLDFLLVFLKRDQLIPIQLFFDLICGAICVSSRRVQSNLELNVFVVERKVQLFELMLTIDELFYRVNYWWRNIVPIEGSHSFHECIHDW